MEKKSQTVESIIHFWVLEEEKKLRESLAVVPTGCLPPSPHPPHLISEREKNVRTV